jgi:hypothetical protein
MKKPGTAMRRPQSHGNASPAFRCQEDVTNLFPLNEITRRFDAVDETAPATKFSVLAVLSLVDKESVDCPYLLMVAEPTTEVVFRFPIPATVSLIRDKDYDTLNMAEISPERICR